MVESNAFDAIENVYTEDRRGDCMLPARCYFRPGWKAE